jgi:hypothetical protein
VQAAEGYWDAAGGTVLVTGAPLFGGGVATSAGALVTAPTSGRMSGVAAVLGGGAATIAPPPLADDEAVGFGDAPGIGEPPLPGHGGPPAGNTPALDGGEAGVPRISSLGL